MKPVMLHTPYRSDTLIHRIVSCNYKPGWPFWLVITRDSHLLQNVIEAASKKMPGYRIIRVPNEIAIPESYESILDNPRRLFFCDDIASISPQDLYSWAKRFREDSRRDTSTTKPKKELYRPIFIGGYIWDKDAPASLGSLTHFSYSSCELVE